jgi:hypothetical protein
MNSVKPQYPQAHLGVGLLCFAIVLPHREHFLFFDFIVFAA